VRDWQNRPLDQVYPVVFFDALRVKIRDEGLVKNKAVYVALALNPDGEKDVLGLWIEQSEGAKFWLKVLTSSRRAASTTSLSPSLTASKASRR
jgi:putative transposase